MVDIIPTPGFVAPAQTVEPAVVAKPAVIEPAHTVEAVPNHVPPFVAGGTVVPASVGVDEPQMVDRGDGVMVDIRTQPGNRPSPLPHGANPSGFSTLSDGQKGGINSAYNVLGAALRQAGVI